MIGMLYVYKSMPNKLQNWKSPAIFISFIVMMAGLFTSRPLLSAAIGIFVLLSFFHNDLKGHLRKFITSPLLWGMTLLFIFPLISGIWSEDRQQWLNVLRIKLPLLFLPVAFAGPFAFTSKQWQWLITIFIVIILIASGWSMLNYTRDLEAINESYLRAKTMRTPLGNDHVRFSWLVSVAVLFTSWYCFHQSKRDWFWWASLIITLWLIVFLHLLAARTGLLAFYIIAIVIVGWSIARRFNIVRTATALSLLILLPIAAYIFLPSFRNRVKYVRYESGYFSKAHYLAGSSDAVRVISWRTGWQAMNAHPLIGTGFGDINSAMRGIYVSSYPSMLEADKILPSSQWLMYGVGNGWPGFLLFTSVLLLPFFIRLPYRGIWYSLNGITAFGFIFDIGLEIQFGVFIYCFTILCCGKWLEAEKV